MEVWLGYQESAEMREALFFQRLNDFEDALQHFLRFAGQKRDDLIFCRIAVVGLECEEFSLFYVEGQGDLFDGVECCGLFAPFNNTDVGGMDIGLFCQLLLGEVPDFPQFPQSASEKFSQLLICTDPFIHVPILDCGTRSFHRLKPLYLVDNSGYKCYI